MLLLLFFWLCVQVENKSWNWLYVWNHSWLQYFVVLFLCGGWRHFRNDFQLYPPKKSHWPQIQLFHLSRKQKKKNTRFIPTDTFSKTDSHCLHLKLQIFRPFTSHTIIFRFHTSSRLAGDCIPAPIMQLPWYPEGPPNQGGSEFQPLRHHPEMLFLLSRASRECFMIFYLPPSQKIKIIKNSSQWFSNKLWLISPSRNSRSLWSFHHEQKKQECAGGSGEKPFNPRKGRGHNFCICQCAPEKKFYEQKVRKSKSDDTLGIFCGNSINAIFGCFARRKT